MALEIQFVDRSGTGASRLVEEYQLRAADGGWSLPTVELAPVDKLPHLASIAVTVTGTPSPVADRIGAAFGSRSFKPPVALSGRKSLGVAGVREAGPLPSGVSCDLRVVAQYHDSDGKGRPILSQTLTVTRSCKLVSLGSEAQVPEIQVRPRELPVTLDKGTELTIEVRRAPTGAIPSVALYYPDTAIDPKSHLASRFESVLPDLKAALAESLRAVPQAADAQGDRHIYRLEVMVQVAPSVKNALQGMSEPLIVPLRTDVAGAKPYLHLMKLEHSANQFPGWLVIDFGTSNSTVTVYDTRDIPYVEGLPQEQENSLRRQMADWLGKAGAEALAAGRQFEAEWRKLLTQVGRTLGGEGPEAVTRIFNTGQGQRMYEVLGQLEIALQGTLPAFRRAVRKRLNEIYNRALHVPPLRQANLYPVVLDPTSALTEVASEIEVRHFADPLVIGMGKSVTDARLKALADADDPTALAAIQSRFYPSPKRYFGTDQPAFTVVLDGQRRKVPVDDLMKASWNHLVQLTEESRARDPLFSKGPFRQVVVTYPTVASPAVRGKIRELVKQLGFSDVRTDYDEAVAAAIFYLMLDFGGDFDIGLEAFKARCQPEGQGRWSQNVLVFDIGGGTTDVALISLVLEEKDPFKPGEDRGAGGRYYVITPSLRRSTGHMQLGGELMTLRIFHLLKAALADKLLELVQSDRLRCEGLKPILAGKLPENFLVKGKFRPGALLALVDREQANNDPDLRAALNVAEMVLPTRWKDEAGRLIGENASHVQAFYTLWELAEKAKRELGKRIDDGALRAPFELRAEVIKELLDQCELDYQATDPARDLRVVITEDQFERAVGSVIDSAVKIAAGTLEALSGGDQVNWLILSGKSCHLGLVDKKIKAAFQKGKRFTWGPSAVTFIPEFAKLATSLGACWAELLRSYRYDPQSRSAKLQLKRGLNQLYFDINNLFFTLPCSFDRYAPNGMSRVFKAGDELYEIDGQKVGKFRSGWEDLQERITIHRVDYEEASPTPWGELPVRRLVEASGWSESSLIRDVKVQFEINHKLEIGLLLCRGRPHYEIKDGLSCNLRQGLARVVAQMPVAGPQAPAPAPVPAPMASLYNEAGELDWEIAVGIPSAGTGGPQVETVFPRKSVLDQLFHCRIGSSLQPDTKRGMIGAHRHGAFPEKGRLRVFCRAAGNDKWHDVGELERPGDEPLYRRQYSFSLDEDGSLRVHPGMVPYWESDDVRMLREQEGCVVRQPLAPHSREANEDRNPFSGSH